MVSARPASARAVLALPGYTRLWLAGGVSTLGDAFTSLALVVLVLRLTHSTAAVAGLLLATSLPQILIGVHAGAFVDRFDRRRVMIASELLRGLLVLGLVAVRAPRDLGWLYGLAIAQAAVGVFFDPARAASLPGVVPPALRLRANALDQTLRLASATAGAAVAGLLLARAGGITLAFVADAASFAFSALLLARAWPASVAAGAADAPPGPAGGARAGLDFVLRSPALAGLFLTFTVATLALGFLNVSFTPFVLERLGASTASLGFVRAAQTAGIAAGGALVGALGAGLAPRVLLVAGVTGLGLGFGALAAVHGVAALFVLAPLLGLASSALEAGGTTLLQHLSPEPLRGRIAAALDTLLAVTVTAAMAGAGLLARPLGERGLFLAGAAGALGAAVIAAVTVRESGGDPIAVSQENLR